MLIQVFVSFVYAVVRRITLAAAFFSEKNKETAGETPAAMETEICPAELHNLPKTVF